MNDNPNRRKDDARPAVALQWGERPDHWTLLLVGPTTGMIGPLGSTWPNQPAEYERVDVCVRRKDGPAVVYRTGGEGAATWQQFYPCNAAEPLRDGEMLYREGAVPKLDSIEQYRLQMAAIGTAAIGYWKLGDSIHPDYDTVPLRDVAALHARYDELSKFRESVRGMVALLKNREWAEDLAATGDAAELQAVITELVGKPQPAPDFLPELFRWLARARFERPEDEATAARFGEQMRNVLTKPAADKSIGLNLLPVAKVRVFGDAVTFQDARLGILKRLDGVSLFVGLSDIQKGMQCALVPPDAVDAALADAIQHGTGAFRVNSDGSTEHVDLQAQNRAAAEIVAFSPPAGVRDALYRDYVVPAPAQTGEQITNPNDAHQGKVFESSDDSGAAPRFADGTEGAPMSPKYGGPCVQRVEDDPGQASP